MTIFATKSINTLLQGTDTQEQDPVQNFLSGRGRKIGSLSHGDQTASVPGFMVVESNIKVDGQDKVGYTLLDSRNLLFGTKRISRLMPGCRFVAIFRTFNRSQARRGVRALANMFRAKRLALEGMWFSLTSEDVRFLKDYMEKEEQKPIEKLDLQDLADKYIETTKKILKETQDRIGSRMFSMDKIKETAINFNIPWPNVLCSIRNLRDQDKLRITERGFVLLRKIDL